MRLDTRSRNGCGDGTCPGDGLDRKAGRADGGYESCPGIRDAWCAGVGYKRDRLPFRQASNDAINASTSLCS